MPLTLTLEEGQFLQIGDSIKVCYKKKPNASLKQAYLIVEAPKDIVISRTNNFIYDREENEQQKSKETQEDFGLPSNKSEKIYDNRYKKNKR